MAYVNPKNRYAPKQRRDVAAHARKIGIRATGRYYGIPPGTVSKWVTKAKVIGYHPIPTKSSRPLAEDVVERIVDVRMERRRTREVVHKYLSNEGINISLSSVQRTLNRQGTITLEKKASFCTLMCIHALPMQSATKS